MAGTGVGKFSSTGSNNTSNMTVNFAENMAPSNVNNAARELMGHMRDMYEQLGDGYFEFGDGDGTYTVARSDADTITITSSSDISGVYFAGRKIRITDGGANVVEGTIASSSHSSTTQTVNLTGISLASGTPTKVELGIDTAAFGGRVILDDDGDTYIEAPTDDTIDIYVAGAKDFVITANTFTAESGSSIVTPTLEVSSAVTLPAGATNIATLDIDGATDIGAAIVDADLFIIDDGAGGTNRKVTASRLKTYAGASSSFTEAVTITVADNSDTLSLISTDADDAIGANLRIYRNSSSPANADNLGTIDFEGRNNNSQDVVYAQILSQINDVADGAEDGILVLKSMIAGTSREGMRISDGGVVINELSQDMDFRVESDGNANMFKVDAGNNQVLIGGTGATLGELGITGHSNSDANIDLYASVGSSAAGKAEIFFTTDSSSDHVSCASIVMEQGSGDEASRKGQMKLNTSDNGAPTTRILLSNNGDVMFNTAATGNQAEPANTNTVGVCIRGDGETTLTCDSAYVFRANRKGDDGEVIGIMQDGSVHGTISISGSTTSYNAFTGSHWGRFADNSKSTILMGTVMETLDAMINWHYANINYPERVEGDVTIPACVKKHPLTLPDGKTVGDAVTFTVDGVEYTDEYRLEDDIKHTQVKISDVADSNRVYGVFNNWDNGDIYNDMHVAQVGTFVVRVHKDVTVVAGDLLVSNGDGTAKVQDDDIIRSKTIAKVNSNIKVETYADGSYTVPCTLHC